VEPDDDVVVYRRPPRDYYEPRGPSIGIGIGGGSGDRGGGHQGRSRGGY
jgi:hypothetical protein